MRAVKLVINCRLAWPWGGTSAATPVALATAVLVRDALFAVGRSAESTPSGILQLLQEHAEAILDVSDLNPASKRIREADLGLC